MTKVKYIQNNPFFHLTVRTIKPLAFVYLIFWSRLVGRYRVWHDVIEVLLHFTVKFKSPYQEERKREKDHLTFCYEYKKWNNMIKTTGITTCSLECTLQPKGFGLLMTYMFACSKHDIFEMWRIIHTKNETNCSKKNTHLQRIMRTYLSKRLTSPMCTRLVTLQKQWTIIKPYITIVYTAHRFFRILSCTYANGLLTL